MGVLYSQWRGYRRKVLPFGVVEVGCAALGTTSIQCNGKHSNAGKAPSYAINCEIVQMLAQIYLRRGRGPDHGDDQLHQCPERQWLYLSLLLMLAVSCLAAGDRVRRRVGSLK